MTTSRSLCLPWPELLAEFFEIQVREQEDGSYGAFGIRATDTPIVLMPGRFKRQSVLLGSWPTHAEAMKEGKSLADLASGYRLLLNLPQCHCWEED